MPYAEIKDGLCLYYERYTPERNSRSEIPLLFLHGFTIDHRMWAPQVAAFKDHWHILVPDARGHGLSDTSETGYSRSDRVEDLGRLVDTLSIKRFHLIGLSMGGSTAIAYALSNPNRLASLVLVSTGAAGYNTGKRMGRIDQLARDKGLESARHAWMKYALAYYGEDQEELKQLMEMMMLEHSGMPWMDPRRGNYPDQGNDLERVHQITTPTAIFTGSNDSVFVPLARQLCNRIPNARLAIYEGVGHMLNLETADRFNADLDRFLSEVNER